MGDVDDHQKVDSYKAHYEKNQENGDEKGDENDSKNRILNQNHPRKENNHAAATTNYPEDKNDETYSHAAANEIRRAGIDAEADSHGKLDERREKDPDGEENRDETVNKVRDQTNHEEIVAHGLQAADGPEGGSEKLWQLSMCLRLLRNHNCA